MTSAISHSQHEPAIKMGAKAATEGDGQAITIDHFSASMSGN